MKGLGFKVLGLGLGFRVYGLLFAELAFESYGSGLCRFYTEAPKFRHNNDCYSKGVDRSLVG